jgi:hypothetical protein
MTDTRAATASPPATAERAAAVAAPRRRASIRSVAVPTEHGGWGLTAEPVLLGLAVAPSLAGVLLGLAAVLAFLARTPLRVVLVDHHRDRDLDRTALARRVLAAELAVLAALVAAAARTADGAFWWPAVIAAPLVAIELWFDTRSRSRRLVPELAGTFGICAVVAMIIVAGGHGAAEAIAAWLVLVARAATAIPHVRAQIARLHGRPSSPRALVVADATALAAATIAVVVAPAAAPGAVAVAALVPLQRITARTPAPAKVVGIRQTVVGLVVVAATAVGLRLA